MKNYSLEEINPALLKVQKPARYVGGEYGIYKPDLDDEAKELTIAICLPLKFFTICSIPLREFVVSGSLLLNKILRKH